MARAEPLFPVIAVGVNAAQLRHLPGRLAGQAEATLLDEGLAAQPLGSLDVSHAVLYPDR